MSYRVLLFDLLTGCVNYCSRYLPFRLRVGNIRPMKYGTTDVLLDTIDIVSVCALLMVPTAPEVMHGVRRFVPALVGFVILDASFYKTRGIIIPTLLDVLGCGLAWRILVGLQIKTIILKK